MNMMKMTLAACAVAVAGFCPAEEVAAPPAKGEACACTCACAERKRCERPKPVSLTLCKDVKDADVEAFKKDLLARVDEAVAKARATARDCDRPPMRLMLVMNDGRHMPPPGGFGCRGPRPGTGPRCGRGQEGCPPPPPPPPSEGQDDKK